MKDFRFPRSPKSLLLLSLCLLAPFCIAPANAQAVTGTLATILDEEPSGSGWNAVVADATAQSQNNGHPLYHSTLVENQTFEGDYTPTRRMVLTIFSDDGSDVTVDGKLIWNGKGMGQTLEILSMSLHKLSVTLEPNTTHHIKVDYSNTYYTGAGDIDGVTLFAYEKTVPYISLDTAQSPVTATYSSPNGIDASSIKFTFDGVDQTSNTTHDGSSLSYTVPAGVNLLGSHAIRIEVKDNDGNLGVGSVSANYFSPGGEIPGWSQTSTVSYNLLGSESIRVRICLWGSDTAARTYTATQGPGEVSTTWAGLDNTGSGAQAEVYVCKVEKLVNGSWIRIADIDPDPSKYSRLMVDGALLTDENTTVYSPGLSTVRTTSYPAYFAQAKGTSYLMVPLVQTATTLLGDVTPQGDKIEDYNVVGDQVRGIYDYKALPDGSPRDSNTLPAQNYGVTYWWLRDVFRLRKSIGTNTINADAHQTTAVTNRKDANGNFITFPVINITTGIPGATVTPVSGPGQMAFRGHVTSNVMAYTFDDGPYDNAGPDTPDTTVTTRNASQPVTDQGVTENLPQDSPTRPDLLSVLKEYSGFKATFFTNGLKIRNAKAFGTTLTADIVSAGHELANHTWSHRNGMDSTNADSVRCELIRSRLMECYASGSGNTNWFRPPGGAGLGYAADKNYPNIEYAIPGQPSTNSPDFWTTIGETGYKVIAWSLQPTSEPDTVAGETSQQQADGVTDYLKSHAKQGFIALLHNGRYHTVLSMQSILPYLMNPNYGNWQFVPVSQINPVFHTTKTGATQVSGGTSITYE